MAQGVFRISFLHTHATTSVLGFILHHPMYSKKPSMTSSRMYKMLHMTSFQLS